MITFERFKILSYDECKFIHLKINVIKHILYFDFHLYFITSNSKIKMTESTKKDYRMFETEKDVYQLYQQTN